MSECVIVVYRQVMNCSAISGLEQDTFRWEDFASAMY